MKTSKSSNFLEKHKWKLIAGGMILAEGVLLALSQEKISRQRGEIKNLKDTVHGQEKQIRNMAYHLGKNSNKH